MEKPLLSVCVITYNQEKYIKQCLDSILMQKTDFKYEIVVAEDCSPDNTREILLDYKERYPDTFNLILHDKNLGVNMNSTSARVAAKGEFLAFCEGDDFWIDENKLQIQVDFLKKHPEYSAVTHNVFHAKPTGEVIKTSIYSKRNKTFTMKDYMNKLFALHGCSLVARNVFDAGSEKYQKLRKSVPTMGDVMTQAILLDKGNIFYIGNKTMSAHRLTDASDTASFTQTSKTKLMEYTYMYKKLTESLEEYFDFKYDFTKKYASRVGFVYFAKVFKSKTYKIDSTDFANLQRTLSLKFKAKASVFALKYLFRAVFRKAKKICKMN